MVPASLSHSEQLNQLRHLLQQMDWRAFEAMVPKLVGQMIGVRFTAARSGFQDGADAGTVGRSGRRLRIEAKRYASNFDARDIIGGLRQAIACDAALECWIAAATRDIPEQLANQLEAEGANAGIPVLTIDWDDSHAPLLAALCTQAPAIVSEHAGEAAAGLATSLEPALSEARAQLGRELEGWQIGYEHLRRATHGELETMWGSKRAAKARFGQDIAGGEGRSVERLGPSQALDNWWQGRAATDAPAAVIGQGGVGKTWAAIGWLMARREQLPILVTIPASAAASSMAVSPEAILRLIGESLATLTGVRDAPHWTARLKRILARPDEEGPALCILIDGINQNPAVPWLSMFHLLQDRPFSGKVRTILTTRPQHFETKLARTRGLVEAAEPVFVERFDLAEGGELDTMLAAHNLTRSDLHEDLIEFARVPRLFGLVVRLRDRLTDAGRITTHRLLWEYGRDVQGERAGNSFSEAEWRAWLAEIARREREGLRTYTLASLGETAARADLEASEVAGRLSDIVDGNFTTALPGGALQLVPEIVAHALGAALLEQLDDVARRGGAIEAELAEWLDPIDGLEERAEVLRAATSIMAERDTPAAPEIAATIVTAWLHTQNLPESHITEIRRLAPRQVQPLLETVERSEASPRRSARALAIDALRSLPFDPVAYGLIVATATRWFSRVSRDVSRRHEGYEQAEAARIERRLARIGVDVSGPLVVLGFGIDLIDHPDDKLLSAAATILDGKPLAGAVDLFARAALAMAIRGRQGVWEDLKWLCLLNPVDPDETAARLRLLSADIAGRPPEPGISPRLAGRVAALLLWLTGVEADEEAAYDVDTGIDRTYSYEEDYLPDPGLSFFRLERRHAAGVLQNPAIVLDRRLHRAAAFLIDPSFMPPESLSEEIRAAALEVDLSGIDAGRFHSQQDREFEELEIGLARCAPDLLADLYRRKLASYAERPTTMFDSSAWSAAEAILVADDAGRDGCRSLRERSVAAGGGMNKSSPSELLIVEIASLPAIDQISTLLDADLEFILLDFTSVLRPLGVADVDALLDANADAGPQRIENLVGLLSAVKLDGLSERAWSWLQDRAFDIALDHRPCAFDILRHCDAARFGRALLEADWSWTGDDNDLCRHHGSLAIAEAGAALPFEEIAPRITPALLARVVRTRGGAPAEAQLAAAILDEVIMRPVLQAPDPGSVLIVNAEDRRQYPMSLSIRPGPMPGEEENPFEALAQGPEARADHSERAIETALARVRQARADGASLYLSSVEASDLGPVLAAAPELVPRWLEGAAERSRDFRRRVHLAEGLYLALCEALLTLDPPTGAALWRALRDAMVTRFTGLGGIEERALMLFRVAENAEVLALRRSLLDLSEAQSDERLLDLAVAAIIYRKRGWLEGAIAEDEGSSLAWRRRRAVMLSGFLTGAELPVAGAELEGADHRYADERRAEAARRRARDAAARHWWHRFVDAQDAESALAAWTLFRRSADRRAVGWLSGERWPNGQADALSWLKIAHFELNEDALVKAAQKQEKDGAKHLLGRRISDDMAPWYQGDALRRDI